MSVGLALIAKNEGQRLPTLLKSIEGAFDRVVLLDTGSKDSTIDVFIAWAREQTGMTFAVGHYDWVDDFADARRNADSLLLWGTNLIGPSPGQTPMVDWTCWADCDDVIKGAQNIRQLCEEAAPTTIAFLCGYDYARDEAGTNVSYLWRERMVRAGHGQWLNRVHEAQNLDGGSIAPVGKDLLEWVHVKTVVDGDPAKQSNTRNLRILRKWARDEPDNPRVLSYLGVEEQIRGRNKQAIRYYRRYLKTDAKWEEERAQVHRRLGMCLIATGAFDDAIQVATTGLLGLPSWTDNYLTLAEAYLAKGEWTKAAEWATQAIERGAPIRTLLIVNPTDYTFLPKKLLAGALGELGQFKEAIELAKEALGIVPDRQLAMAAQQWQGVVKRENTADTYALAAEQLIAHDEQIKALTLLEQCVPVFAQDHPRVVGLRSALRERLMWMHSSETFTEHYTTGGSKPEDFIPDDEVDGLCERLPRCGFLLDGVLEQHAEMAA